MENNKQDQIHEKGFGLYNKIKVGPKTLSDATLNLEELEFKKWYRMNNTIDYTNKNLLYRAVAKKDYKTIIDFSRHYYEHNGVYRKAVDYLATLYHYDWYIAPQILDEAYGNDKIKKEFYQMLDFLDSSYIKKNCENWARAVLKNGVYYGYRITTESEGVVMQDLDPLYCRSTYSVGNLPVVEFDMSYFDHKFVDPIYRLKVLDLFPKEFKKGYLLYKEGKLPKEWNNGAGHWYSLDPGCAVVFQITDDRLPWFLSSIPYIIDYEVSKDIDRRKQLQQLAKIIIQKLPLDKNGDLIFDLDEAADLHKNAVDMLKNVVGVDVFTTFADVDDVDLSSTAQVADKTLENAKGAVYDAMGIASNLFNSDGNLSVDKSAKIDAGSIRQLILQFEIFYNRIVLENTAKPKKYKFRFYMLDTTEFNYQDLAKFYKEGVINGDSKLLPQICMGRSQSSILHLVNMENDILELSYVFVPPMKDTNTDPDNLDKLKQGRSTGSDTKGRPALADDQKSDKTIQNIEAAS